jgi:4-hydroxybenzoate polyprenyltransferase
VSSLRTYLTLGRISNLPTVWSNTLAGAVLAGEARGPSAILACALACSIFYTGGMFLNDAFDRAHDAREQPFRPIPAGKISAAAVFVLGFAQLALGALLVGLVGAHRHTLLPSLLGSAALALSIVVYDLWHKQNPLSPVLMGLCRAFVYITAALALRGSAPGYVLVGAFALFAYLNVLTAIAKRRGVPGRTVARFIAGISLVDASCIALAGAPIFAAVAALGFPLTLAGQRYVRGT